MLFSKGWFCDAECVGRIIVGRRVWTLDGPPPETIDVAVRVSIADATALTFSRALLEPILRASAGVLKPAVAGSEHGAIMR